MNELVRGVVLNVNVYGATVRLEDGRLASVVVPHLDEHRPEYERAASTRKNHEFVLQSDGRHPVVVLAPQIRDEAFEEQIASYLKMTQEWEKPDMPPAHERHFLRKKRRAAIFESRHATDR